MINLLLLSLLAVLCFPLTAHGQVRPYAPELFPEELSGAVCGFANRGRTIYFVREDTTKQKLLLFEADWNGTKWEDEKPLPFSGEFNDYGGRLSQDGNTFYFTSDRPGASDNKDDVWNIWKVTRSASGWNEPQPLKDISGNGDECCPVPLPDGSILFSGTMEKSEWQIMTDDNRSTAQDVINSSSAWQWPSYYDTETGTLFFNSMKRSDSKRMDDIYAASFNDSKWKNVRNLGEAINSPAYEDGAILSFDRKLLIFCRHQTGSSPSKVLCIKVKQVLKDFE